MGYIMKPQVIIFREGGKFARCEKRHKPLRWDISVYACYDRRKFNRVSIGVCFRCGNRIATTVCPQTPRLVNGRHTQGLEPWWQKIPLLGSKHNSCIYGLEKVEQIEVLQQSSPSAFSPFYTFPPPPPSPSPSLDLFPLLLLLLPLPPLSLSLSLFPFPSSFISINHNTQYQHRTIKSHQPKTL